MRKSINIISIFILLFSCTVIADGSNPENDTRIPDEGQLAEFDFEYSNGSIILPVTINGDTRNWILDNGCQNSIIDSSYAEELSCPVTGHGYAYGVVNPVLTTEVNINEIKVGDLEVPGGIIKSHNLNDFLFPYMGQKIYGLLGMDFLYDFVVRIDIAHKIITFFDRDTFVYHGRGQIFDNTFYISQFYIPAKIDDVYEGYLGIDFGAGSLVLNKLFVEMNEIKKDNAIYLLADDVGGTIELKTTKFNDIKIGDYSVNDPLTNIICEQGSSIHSDNSMGLLGTSILRHFVVYLDHENGRLIFEKGTNYQRDFPSGYTGIDFRYAEDYLFIDRITPDSPASDSGFMKGDIFRIFEGRELTNLQSRKDMRNALLEGAGKTFTLTVEREGKLLDLELTPVDIHDLL